MGNINATPATMDDDTLQFGRIVAALQPGDDPLLDRFYVHAEFAVDLDIDETKYDSSPLRLVASHPALTEQERLSFAALCKKMHNYEANLSKWVGQ